jgi:hypothetical protein
MEGSQASETVACTAVTSTEVGVSGTTVNKTVTVEYLESMAETKDLEATEARNAADEAENQSKHFKELAAKERQKALDAEEQARQFRNAAQKVTDAGEDVVRTVKIDQKISVQKLDHSTEVSAFCTSQEVEGTIEIGDQKVWPTFPSLTLFALKSVMRTTLGTDIIRAVIPCEACLIRFAELLNWAMTYFSNVHPLVGLTIIILSGCESGGLPVSIGYQWVMRCAAFFAFMYLVALVLIYLLCIYFPLKCVIMSVAVVQRVPEHRQSDIIQLQKCTLHQSIRGVEIDLESHALAARLTRQTEIVIMTYTDGFETKCQEMFFRELSTYKFFVTQWLFMEAKRFSDMNEDMSVFDNGWGRFAGTLLIVAWCYILPHCVSWALKNTWHVVKKLLDRIFCFIPTNMQRKAKEKIVRVVLNRAVPQQV